MIRIIGGTLLLVLAAFMLLGFSLSENEDTVVTIIVLLVAVVTPAGAGIALIRSGRRALPASARASERREIGRVQSPESEVLLLASRREGKLTDVEVSAHLGMSIEAAREHLEELARKEAAEIQVTDGGVLVYVFPAFRPHAEDSSKGLLEG